MKTRCTFQTFKDMIYNIDWSRKSEWWSRNLSALCMKIKISSTKIPNNRSIRWDSIWLNNQILWGMNLRWIKVVILVAFRARRQTRKSSSICAREPRPCLKSTFLWSKKANFSRRAISTTLRWLRMRFPRKPKNNGILLLRGWGRLLTCSRNDLSRL